MSDYYERADEEAARLARLEALLASPPRELTSAELRTVLPMRGPRGSAINRVRMGVWRRLRHRGFTWAGRAMC